MKLLQIRDLITMLEATDRIEKDSHSWHYSTGLDILHRPDLFNAIHKEALSFGFFVGSKAPKQKDFESWLIHISNEVKKYLESNPIKFDSRSAAKRYYDKKEHRA